MIRKEVCNTRIFSQRNQNLLKNATNRGCNFEKFVDQNLYLILIIRHISTLSAMLTIKSDFQELDVLLIVIN
jgi:hypothetical protein